MPVAQLKPVEQLDREEFVSMAIEHFRSLNPTFVPHEDWNQHYFTRIHGNPNFSLNWIDVKGKNAGFILFGVEDHRFLPRKTGVIYELYVKPEFRRQGVARSAALEAIRKLTELSPSKIQLEVVEGNLSAAALWKSLGFRKVTERYVWSGEGH